MEKVRINNDLLIKYTVLRDGLPESFVGATDITVTVTNEAYKKAISNTFDIVGNIVNISIDAADFNLCGKYRVTLKYVRGNDIEIDALAFEGVQYTSLTGGTEIVGVEVVTVNISGDIGIAIPDNNKIDLDGLNSNIDKLHFKPDTLVQLAEIGDVRYSTESKTLEVKVSDTVSIQLGQEMQTRVKNDAGVQIDNGQLVYINSAAGANPLAKIASTTDANIAQRTFGMATENIAFNGFGAITTEGLVRDVNTAAFTEGDMLWLGVNGAVTNIEPVAPTPKISVGMVLRSNVANGVIYVKIRAISRNQKLSDVYAPTLTGGDILRWNSTTLRFETFNVTTALAGKADLVGGKIPTSQLPSYVDDVLEYANIAAFPATGETGKIYLTLDTNLTYRWSGTAYVEISKSLALGETADTAYRGDRGKIAYDHSQTTGNPHSTTAAQIPNTPAGTVAATTVQGAINELAGDIVQVETNLNTKKSIVSADDDHYRLINLIGLQTGYAGYLGNYTLHGFEYTPAQNDDIVTGIGNTNYNTNKPIQSQMRPFEELIATKERFYLRDDVTKRIDGSASNLTDPNYLQKVYIPEFWYGAMFDSVRNKVQVWFSLVPVPGFMHIAQQAVCRYPGYIDGTGKARSHSGYKYPNNKNLIEFTTACQLTSEDLFVLPYYTYNALSLLLLHDIGRRNAQAIWSGLQTGSTYSNITSGKTDILVTPSGEVPADAETAANKPFRWRFIENLYGDCWKILSGVYLNQVGAERRVMICPDPYKANTNSVISADYIQACIIAAGEGWLKDINAPWINAKAYGASSTTGYCDYTYNNTTDKNILIAGVASNSGAYDGPFSLLSNNSASSRSISFGALFASIDRLPAATQVVKPALIY